MSRLLPRTVCSSERYGNPEYARILPGEHAVVASATDERRREFATVRLCARASLRALGAPAVPLVPGRHREPRWPPSVVGSMTHCTGYRAAAVAWSRHHAAVGIDAEEHAPLPDATAGLIGRPDELQRLQRLQEEHPGVHWTRLLFSAKESVFKAWYPLTGRWLGFDDAKITFEPNGASFTAELLVPGPLICGQRTSCFRGRWVATGALLLTAVVLPRPAP